MGFFVGFVLILKEGPQCTALGSALDMGHLFNLNLVDMVCMICLVKTTSLFF